MASSIIANNFTLSPIKDINLDSLNINKNSVYLLEMSATFNSNIYGFTNEYLSKGGGTSGTSGIPFSGYESTSGFAAFLINNGNKITLDTIINKNVVTLTYDYRTRGNVKLNPSDSIIRIILHEKLISQNIIVSNNTNKNTSNVPVQTIKSKSDINSYSQFSDFFGTNMYNINVKNFLLESSDILNIGSNNTGLTNISNNLPYGTYNASSGYSNLLSTSGTSLTITNKMGFKSNFNRESITSGFNLIKSDGSYPITGFTAATVKIGTSIDLDLYDMTGSTGFIAGVPYNIGLHIPFADNGTYFFSQNATANSFNINNGTGFITINSTSGNTNLKLYKNDNTIRLQKNIRIY